MLASLLAACCTVAAPVEADRLYNGVDRPLPVSVAAGTGRHLVLLDSGNRELARTAVGDDAAGVDLAERFPTLYQQRATCFVQLLVEGEATGPALVLQPMIDAPAPVIEYQQRGGQSYPVVVSWMQNNPQAGVMTGFRAYPEMDVLLETTHGEIRIRLRPDESPNTAWNFRSLVEGGFYTDIPFHRVVAKNRDGHPFVIQAGDPTGTGEGGPGYSIDLEQSDLKHDLGVISMAREGHDLDTAGSQFFLCLSREGTQHLDNQYGAFGETIAGIDVVQAIAAVEVGPGDRPVEMPRIISARLVEAASRVPGVTEEAQSETIEGPEEDETVER